MVSFWLRRLTPGLWQSSPAATTGVLPMFPDAAAPVAVATRPAWQEALWLAVPKKKVTRHKKRLKTTVQKRIKLRRDIVTDPRTGETTLRHKMPFNWKDYLPKVD